MTQHLHDSFITRHFTKPIGIAAAMLLCLGGNAYSQTSNSLNFDGSDDYAVIPGNVVSTGSYTKEAWIRLSDVNGFAAQNILTEPNNAFYVYNSGRLAAGKSGGTIPAVADPGQMTAGAWYQVAVTYNAVDDSMILYRNGVRVAAGLADPNDQSGPTAIGAIDYYGYGYTFYGDMTEIRIWDYARTAAEVALTANCRVPGDTPGLVALFNAEDGTADGDNTAITTLHDITGNGHDATLNGFALTGTSSNFTAAEPTGVSTCTVLPVTLSAFTAKAENQSVLLSWQTATELNNAGFALERSANGNSDWEKIAFVAGNGNSVSVHNYQYRDISPLAGKNYYRLNQQDLDGHSKYSNIVSASISGAARISVYPTVASSVINVGIPDRALLQTPYIIYDNSGKTVQKGLIQSTRQSINISDLGKGVFYLKVQSSDAIQFIKQ